MKKLKLLLSALFTSALVLPALSGCNPDNGPKVNPIVSQVRFEDSSLVVSLDGTLNVTCDVRVIGAASKAVTWSVEDPTILSVTSTGDTTCTLRGLKTGVTNLTATSVFNPTKSATVPVTVRETGFDDTFLDEGYEFSKTFPVNQIKTFFGDNTLAVPVLEGLEGGCYIQVFEADTDQYIPAYVEVVVDGIRDEEYIALFSDMEGSLIYSSDYGMDVLDPTRTYDCFVTTDADEETYESVAPTYIQFYAADDLFYGDTLTTDKAWNQSAIDSESMMYLDEINYFLDYLPFVALGENYSISYVVDDSELEFLLALMEAFGMDVESMTDEELEEFLAEIGYEPTVYMEICDFSYADALANYGQTLLNNDYVFTSDYEGNEYYSLAVGIESIDVSYSFTQYGNTIHVETGIALLDAFPIEAVNDFVEKEIKSIYSIPNYGETENAQYMATISDGSFIVACEVAEEADADAYALLLEQAGFEVKKETTSYGPMWTATKGRIVLDIIFYSDDGELEFMIYADDSKHEEQGIYFAKDEMNAYLASGEITLEPEIVSLDGANFTWTSSDTTVATVEGGVVTLLTAGDVDITITSDVLNDQSEYYSATITLHVIDADPMDEINEKVNELIAEYFELEQTITLPGIDCEEFEEPYYDSDYECVSFIALGATTTVEQYGELLEAAGFEVGYDEEYELDIAIIGDLLIGFYDYGGDLYVDIYLNIVEEESGATFDFSEGGYEISGDNGTYFYEASKGSGSSAPATCSDTQEFNELRLYDKNTLTISSDTEITSIEFTCNNCSHAKAGGSLTCSTGTLQETSTGYLWTGSAKEVVFTCKRVGSGDAGKQCHIETMVINGGGSGSGTGGGTTTGKTSLELIQALAENIFGNSSAYDVDGGDYWTGCTWGSTSEYTLLEAVEEASYYLPEEFTNVVEEPVEDIWEDGSDGAFATYCTDNGIYCDIGAYEDDGDVVVQFVIYEE